MSGNGYAQMIRTIRDVVEQRTGCKNIRLRVSTGFRIQEPDEIIAHYGLGEYFKGKAKRVTCLDKGVPIETEIGTLYGIASMPFSQRIRNFPRPRSRTETTWPFYTRRPCPETPGARF